MNASKILIFLLSICCIVSAEKSHLANNDNSSLCDSSQGSPVSRRVYGSAEVSKFVEAGKGLRFVCCVDDWPEIIGKNITVELAGVYEPNEIGTDKTFYYKQLSIFLTDCLKDGEIELTDIRRSQERFAIVADVKVDRLHLAPKLITRGLASAEPPMKQAEDAEQKKDDKLQDPAAKTAAKDLQKNKQTQQSQKQEDEACLFVCSQNSDVFHKKDCVWAKRIKKENLVRFETRKQAIEAGKRPCEKCNP